ncbi:hypothetical protein BGZ51_002292 [Haplosporangium sp. Z 767]|nr:hypothetical protein BGZ51_002292 [Haplosporangium sp. Z 767]
MAHRSDKEIADMATSDFEYADDALDKLMWIACSLRKKEAQGDDFGEDPDDDTFPNVIKGSFVVKRMGRPQKQRFKSNFEDKKLACSVN